MIIAITGLMGAGKDSAAMHLNEKHDFRWIDYAEILRSLLKEEGIAVTRESMQNYRVREGRSFLAENAAEVIKTSGDRIVITPMRTIEDYMIPKELFGAVLVNVFASKPVRFNRLLGGKYPMKTKEQFDSQQEREFQIYDFDRLFEMADYVVDNNSSIVELKKEIDKLVEVLLKS
jgi:dephospho-CoA kinase